MRKFLLLVGLLSVSMILSAAEDLHRFETEEQKAAFKKLTVELRCPKCQNQNLADSNSEIAVIMRDVIAEEINRGQSEEQIKDMMVDRYSEFVLYMPPVESGTYMLWVAPFFILGAGFIVFLIIVLRRRNTLDDDIIDEE